MGYDQGAVGVPSYRPLSVPVEPTTSRRPVFVRTIAAYSLSRQAAYPCSHPPAPRARVAPHPKLIYPVLLLLPRVMGTAISRGVGVNIAPKYNAMSRGDTDGKNGLYARHGATVVVDGGAPAPA